MVPGSQQPRLESQILQREIMRLRQRDNVTNLFYLALDYFCLVAVVGTTIAFAQLRVKWHLPWTWNVPVFATAIVLVGGIQHRFAGLGHESAHFAFLENRVLNDLIADLFCMFPLMTTVQFYRLFHMAHHQFTNDPTRDPDLLNVGHGKRADEFPMTRWRFIRVIYFCFLTAPIRFLRYQWGYIVVNALGQGRNTYQERNSARGLTGNGRPRLGTIFGIMYLFAITLLFYRLGLAMPPHWFVPVILFAIALATVTIYCLPDWALFWSPIRQAYSTRSASVVRLAYYTTVLAILVHLGRETGGLSTFYAFMLWVVPMGSSFMFFMFLRDVYQHSNADAGRLTNSRVFFTDPFTRWAVFVYGQDMHIPHHLFPTVPHYRLRALHQLLRRSHQQYRDQVVETHGTFYDGKGRRTILDEMTRPTATLEQNEY
jgi:fatty acid desaturase